LDKLFVDTFIKDQSPKSGQSRPLLVEASDGKRYILKNNIVYINGTWVDENCAFFNEVVGHFLATFLNIKTPDIAMLEIEQDIMSANSDLLFERRLTPGLYFGTKLIDNVEENLEDNYLNLMRLKKPYLRRSWNQFFKQIENPQDIASIIVLDLLLQNFDRFNNLGNLLIGSDNTGRNVFAIDHGHCFKGPVYNANKLSTLQSNDFKTSKDKEQYINSIFWSMIDIAQYSHDINGNVHHRAPFNQAGEIFRCIEQHIDLSDPNNHSFLNPVSKLNTLDRTTLNNIMSQIPSEWTSGGATQKKAYIDFLMRQAIIIPEILQKLIYNNAFSNYRGGEISWKLEKHTGTQS